MSPAVLSECNVAVDQSSLHRWQLCCSEILLAKQTINRSGCGRGHKHALGIHPLAFNFGGAGADEHGTRSAQRDQLMRIHGQVVGRQRARILQKVAGHPMIFACSRKVLNQLTKIATVELRTALA